VAKKKTKLDKKIEINELIQGVRRIAHSIIDSDNDNKKTLDILEKASETVLQAYRFDKKDLH